MRKEKKGWESRNICFLNCHEAQLYLRWLSTYDVLVRPLCGDEGEEVRKRRVESITNPGNSDWSVFEGSFLSCRDSLLPEKTATLS